MNHNYPGDARSVLAAVGVGARCAPEDAPKRELEIPEQLGRLLRVVESAEAAVASLLQRLEPTMRSEPSSQIGTCEKAEGPSAPLARELDTYVQRIGNLADNMNRALGRLEV